MRAQSFLLKGNSLDDLAVVIYYVRRPNYMWKHIARTSIGVVPRCEWVDTTSLVGLRWETFCIVSCKFSQTCKSRLIHLMGRLARHCFQQRLKQ